MTYVVTEACIGVHDQSCIGVCPEYCIFSEDIDQISYIDPNRCTNCGVCMAACVVGAIFLEQSLPKESAEFLNLNEYWFKHKTSVRERIKELATELV